MNLGKKIGTKRIVILALATFAIFAVIFQTSVQFDELVSVLGEARTPYIVLAIFIGFVGMILATIRWGLLLFVANYRVPFPRVFSIVMATWTLSVIPGRIGDFLRAYPLRKSVPVPVSIGTIAFEKIIDLISLLLLSAGGFFYLGMPLVSFFLMVGVVVIIALLILAQRMPRYFPQKIADLMQSALTVIVMAKIHKMPLAGSILASVTNWFMSVLLILFLFRAFGVSLDIAVLSAYLPLAIIIGLIPISIAGMGTRDSALIFFLLPFAPAAEILAAGLGYSLIGYILFSILGIPFLLREIRSS